MPYLFITLSLFILGTFGAIYGVSESAPSSETNPSNITFSEVTITSGADTLEETATVTIKEEVLVTQSEESAVESSQKVEVPPITEIEPAETVQEVIVRTGASFEVPFYSQLTDITAPNWKKIGCGIASLAMLIEHHNPGKVEVNTLLQEGIDANAYLSNAGWTYAGLIKISKKYGMGGAAYDLGGSSMETAFSRLETALEKGPVMVSVHYTFDPKNPIPHLAIATGIEDGVFYYNDPAEETGGGSISVEQFKSSWKKRYIEFYPTT